MQIGSTVEPVSQNTLKNNLHQLQCTDDDNRSYRNVCNMSLILFSLAVIFILRLLSNSAFRVPMFMRIVTCDETCKRAMTSAVATSISWSASNLSEQQTKWGLSALIFNSLNSNAIRAVLTWSWFHSRYCVVSQWTTVTMPCWIVTHWSYCASWFASLSLNSWLPPIRWQNPVSRAPSPFLCPILSKHWFVSTARIWNRQWATVEYSWKFY